MFRKKIVPLQQILKNMEIQKLNSHAEKSANAIRGGGVKCPFVSFIMNIEPK